MDRRLFLHMAAAAPAALAKDVPLAPNYKIVTSHKPTGKGMPGLYPGRVSSVRSKASIDVSTETVSVPVVQEMIRQGMTLLTGDKDARDAWARKMALRARRGDIEGDYRRAWLLTALLDDYFVTRGRWFEGPKKSLEWLRVNLPALHHAFEVALRPGASVESIDELVDLATRRTR